MRKPKEVVGHFLPAGSAEYDIDREGPCKCPLLKGLNGCQNSQAVCFGAPFAHSKGAGKHCIKAKGTILPLLTQKVQKDRYE